MFCAEHRQRNGKAQVGHGNDPVEAASPSDIVFRREQADYEQREAGGRHPERSAGEFKERGENRWVHGAPESDSVVLAQNLMALGHNVNSAGMVGQ